MADDVRLVFTADTAPIDRAVRVMDNLEAELRNVERAMDAGIITEEQFVAETTRLKNSMTQLKTAAKGSARDFRVFEKAVYGSGKALRQKEVAMQQAGYQIQDFIVQVQAGTNPLIAFSQQGSQLAGFFAGSWGAAIGLGIAAVGFLGTALLGLGEKAKSVEERIEDLADAFDLYKKVMDTNAIAQVNDEFGRTSSVLIQIQRELNNITKIKAFEALDSATEGLNQTLDGWWGRLENIKTLLEVDGVFAAGGKEVGSFSSKLEHLSDSTLPLKHRLQDALDIKKHLLNNVGPFEKMNEEQRKFYEQLLAVIDAMEKATLLASPKAKKTGYENEMTGVMEFMNTQTVNEYQRGMEGIQRIQMGIAQTEAERERQAQVYHEAFIGRQNAAKTIQKKNSDAAFKDFVKLSEKLIEQANLGIELNNKAADAKRKKLEEQAADELALFDANLAYEQEQSLAAMAELGEEAEKLGGRLGISFSQALIFIRQAKEEAMVGLDAFGGAGSFKYSTATTFDPNKVKKPKVSKKADPVADLKKQLTLEKALVGETEARQRVIEALGVTYSENNPKIVEGFVKQIELIKELTDAENQRLQIQQTVESAMEDGWMSMIDGTKSVTEAFKDMARQIILELYRVMVVQRTVKAMTGFFGFADGGVFQGGSQVQAFANGGVVGSPTYFPMSGNKTGLMGEAGPEAIMPLKRGKNGKLGVSVEGGSGDTITVNQTINVSTGVQQTVRTEIKSLMPQIAESAKAAVADAKRRGGSYGKAF